LSSIPPISINVQPLLTSNNRTQKRLGKPDLGLEQGQRYCGRKL